jgi:hypothetical protein
MKHFLKSKSQEENNAFKNLEAAQTVAIQEKNV